MRTYRIRLLIVMGAYVVLVPLSLVVIPQVQSAPLRIIVALLPVIPVPFGILSLLAYLRQLDELQRRIHLEAFGFSLGMTGMTTFTLGFLENAGVPSLNIIWVFPMMIAFWGVGQIIARRRY